jgi:hypothetical protein
MSYDKLNAEIEEYELSLFNPARFVKPEYHQQYEEKARSKRALEFSQAERENFLIGMMKVNFLKRLESSVKSFAITMERTANKIEDLEKRIMQFQKKQSENPEIDYDSLQLEELEDEELQELMSVGRKLIYNLAHLDLDRWLKALQKDKEQIEILYNAAQAVTPDRDAKLTQLKELVKQKIQNPTTTKYGKPNKKILLFTAFADTATYLYNELSNWAQKDLGVHIALVTGGNSENKSTFTPKGFTHQTEYGNILANFSPIAKNRSKMDKMPQDSEIDILIATDCISEGQNLQDCDYLINYDIHWNPVRIIQRFGRIDRIGSINNEIQLVNFWPTDKLNDYIKLKHRVESRMALVDMAATNEDNVLTMNELEDLITEDLRYRDKQLLKLREEILDLEDFNESVSLSEFSLDDFRLELSKYIEANRAILEQAPFGLYTVVPPSTEYQQIQPGVIFCLKQKGETSASEKVNPVQPYYLVFIRDDGEVRYSFAQTKQVLEVLRHLCLDKREAYSELCGLFDEETQQGRDMKKYDALLSKSVQTITEMFRLRSARNLTTGRDAVLIPESQQPQEPTDFELVTWVVIKSKVSN